MQLRGILLERKEMFHPDLLNNFLFIFLFKFMNHQHITTIIYFFHLASPEPECLTAFTRKTYKCLFQINIFK